MDLRALIRSATPSDIDVAEEALELITARGYHRGKKLIDALRALL